MKGLVVKKVADKFEVRADEEVFSCIARGNLKKEGVFVGDFVDFTNENVISSIFPRKNLLIRPPMANLDKMIIVIAPKPAVDFYLVDKLILFCFLNGIHPILCVNKIDSEEDKTYLQNVKKIYSKVLKVISTSALKKDVKVLLKEIKGICAFAGQSAVGKSSLINALFNESKEATDGFAKKVERGKQTTRTITLYNLLQGNYIADTAGFSKLDESLLEVEQNEISRYYPDMIDFIKDCKFRSCLHNNSENCAIIKEVKKGTISKVRYENYLKLLEAKKRRF